MQSQLKIETASSQIQDCLQLPLFYDWLRQKADTVVGHSSECSACPIAQYLTDYFFHSNALFSVTQDKVEVWVAVDDLDQNPFTAINPPKWVTEFIYLVDGQKPSGVSLTGSECLQAIWHLLHSRSMREWGKDEWVVYRKRLTQKSLGYRREKKHKSWGILRNAARRIDRFWLSLESGDRTHHDKAINTNPGVTVKH